MCTLYYSVILTPDLSFLDTASWTINYFHNQRIPYKYGTEKTRNIL